ncbi:gliding motility lipoprotein GldB [Pedobacter sp. HMWF019]|uniref:gliding motility lipoprotein GldB n=1 Tax=Pedobacter sp. HMWF019 TaxID=2056856 RepID=UPI000D385E14|nr:gliding motility lipoprotein GldB [Pedobacter sp. HMWF019]PTT00862.1 gliding motility lipoprotein GldB [Pedobacter sp. HMWF019]
MRYNVKHPQIYLFFLLALVFFSCRQSKKPDVSQIKIDIHIERFDKDLAQFKKQGALKADQLLKKKYGSFYDDYIHRMIGTPDYTGAQILDTLYQDKAYADLSKEADGVFPSLAQEEQSLSQVFKYIKYYYPNAHVPKFIAFISGFAVQMPIGDNYMGLGLDMFLGKDSQFYRAIVTSVPVYLSRRFSPEYISPRIAETYAREELFPEREENRSLISKMIYSGKILYFMDKVLDDQVSDEIKIGYTPEQLNWCKKYEGNIWAFFMENELLFSTDYPKMQVFLSEGPFTPGIGEKNQSAPKLGIWTGWQIVRKYMEKNPEITLQQLMEDNDAQKILSASKYKPK